MNRNFSFIAKLRRIRAQTASSGDSDSDTYEKRYVRTSKGVLKIIRRGKSVQSGLVKGRQLIDAATSMTSVSNVICVGIDTCITGGINKVNAAYI